MTKCCIQAAAASVFSADGGFSESGLATFRMGFVFRRLPSMGVCLSQVATLSVGVFLGTLTSGAHADPSWSWQLRHGQSKTLQGTVLSAVSPSRWGHLADGWMFRVSAEIELGQWRPRMAAPGSALARHTGALVLVRLQPSGPSLVPYAEVGIGAALFDRKQVSDRNIATAFQFSEHFGLGLQWRDRMSLGWRYTHYSNAGLGKPNDGIDMHSLVLGVRF